MGLDGYCPVTLVERQQWAMGDARFGAVHRGKTYLFIGPNEVKKFLADPDKYAPVLSGNDPVLAMDGRQLVPGRREYGVYSDNRVYLFADESSRRRFEENPARYGAEAIQAANGAPVMRERAVDGADGRAAAREHGRLMWLPIERAFDRFLPHAVVAVALVGRHCRLELSIEHPVSGDVGLALPIADGQAGQVGRAQGRGLGDLWPSDG